SACSSCPCPPFRGASPSPTERQAPLRPPPAPQWSGAASQRPTAVVGDHVGQRAGSVQRPAALPNWLGEVGVRPVQVTDDPFRVTPLRVAPEAHAPRRLQG